MEGYIQGNKKVFKVPMVNLGGSRVKVSKLGISTFNNVNLEEGTRILTESYKLGINFWDTSDDYGTHPHIASALKYVCRKNVVISTKTYAQSGKEAEASLHKSLKELNTDYVDIFFLHYVKSDWIDGAHQVLKELEDIRMTDTIKAIGLSTHSVTVVREAANFEELDIIMTICCKANQALINKFLDRIPLEDGTMKEMLYAIKLAHSKGKGIIAMKVLGGGAPPFVKNYKSALKSVYQLDFVDSIVVGVRSLDEVKKNIDALAHI